LAEKILAGSGWFGLLGASIPISEAMMFRLRYSKQTQAQIRE